MPTQLPTDMLNESLKEIVYLRHNQPLFKKLARQTHFNLREVEALALIHRKIVSEAGPLTISTLRDVLHAGFDYTENIRHLLVDRVFSAIDTKNLLQLQSDQWNEGLSIMLRGNLDQRKNFAYKVYDLMRTSKLKKDQIFPMMRGCLIKLPSGDDPDENVRDLIDLMLKKLDVGRDGEVSDEDFSQAVLDRNTFYLECMGPVFPSREAKYAFSTTFTEKLGRF